MKKRIFCFVFFSLIAVLIASSQVFIEVGPVQNNRDAFSNVTVYGTGGLAKNVPLTQIKGTAFWQDAWMKAYFFDPKDKSLGSCLAKFNFAAQEVYYLDTGRSMKVVPPGAISAVIFMRDDDSIKIATVFRNNIEDVKQKANCKTCFVQELNQGHTKLLKITQRLVKTGDSLFGTIKTYFFTDAAEYFVQTGDQYNRIKRLNKDHFFPLIPGSSLYRNWIKEKGLRFNKENDFLIFLEHYNATYQKD